VMIAEEQPISRHQSHTLISDQRASIFCAKMARTASRLGPQLAEMATKKEGGVPLPPSPGMVPTFHDYTLLNRYREDPEQV